MIPFGMPTLIENRTLQDNISLCSRLGLRFIELNMNFPEYQTEELEQTERLAEAADAAGIYYTIHLDENLNIADFNRLVTDAYLETVRRTVEVAKKLLPLRDRYGDAGRPLTINMHMHHGIYITLPDRKVQMYERDLDRYLESCRRFRDLCGEWIGHRNFSFPGGDIRQIAEILVGIQAVTNHISVGNVKPGPVRRHEKFAVDILVQEDAGPHAQSAALLHIFPDGFQGQPGVEYIIDDQDMTFLHRIFQVASDRQLAGGAVVMVAGTDEHIPAERLPDRTHQIGSEKQCAVHQDDHSQRFALIKTGDIISKFIHPPGNLFFGDQNFHKRIHSPSKVSKNSFTGKIFRQASTLQPTI